MWIQSIGGNPAQELSFDYVDANNIKIDNEVYKYELTPEKSKNFTSVDPYGPSSTGTVKSRVLKIYVDGVDEDPLLLWSAEPVNVKFN